MKQVKVLDEPTKRAMSQLEVQGAALEDDADDPAVAEAKPAVVGDDDVDAMDALEVIQPGPHSQKRAIAAKRLIKSQQVVEVTMHAVLRCSFPSSLETKNIMVHLETSKRLWVGVQHLGWLCEYAASEVAFGNVSTELSGPAADAANCEVEHLHVAWDSSLDDT